MNRKKTTIKKINCKEAVKRFNDFIDNYLKGKGNAREELMQHIESCSHCFERLEFEQLMKRKINKLGKSASVNELKAKENIETVISKLLTVN
jgi:hypothetical protein